MRPRCLLWWLVLSCACAPMRGAPSRELGRAPVVAAGLPGTVSAGAEFVAPRRRYELECLPRRGAPGRLCAVREMQEGQVATGDPARAAALLSNAGSTTSRTTWFDDPRPSAARTFTFVGKDGVRHVTCAQTATRFEQSHAFGTSTPAPTRASVVHVVDSLREADIPTLLNALVLDGSHASAHIITAEASSTLDLEGPLEPLVQADDLAWQRGDPKTRSLARISFQKELPGNLPVDGHVDARMVQVDASSSSCVSFRYFVGRTLRGTYECGQSQRLPSGILVVDGIATWTY